MRAKHQCKLCQSNTRFEGRYCYRCYQGLLKKEEAQLRKGKNEKTRCCALCGRDTKRDDGICNLCRGYSDRRATDQRGRKIRDLSALGGTCLEAIEEEDCLFPSDFNYHGESIRDDI